jgi:hypothetical protein
MPGQAPTAHGARVSTATARLGGAAGRGAPHPRSWSTPARTTAREPLTATTLVGNAAWTTRTESLAAVRGESGERSCRDADTTAASDTAAASHWVRLQIGVAGQAREARRVVGVGQHDGVAYRTEATVTLGQHGRNGGEVADSATRPWETVRSGRRHVRRGGASGCRAADGGRNAADRERF